MRDGVRRRIALVAVGCLLAGVVAVAVVVQLSDGDEGSGTDGVPAAFQSSDPPHVRQVEARLRLIARTIRDVESEVPAIERVASSLSTKCVPVAAPDQPFVEADFRSTGSIPDQLADFKTKLVSLGFKGKELVQGTSAYALKRDEGTWTANVLMVQNGKDTFVIVGTTIPDPCD